MFKYKALIFLELVLGFLAVGLFWYRNSSYYNFNTPSQNSSAEKEYAYLPLRPTAVPTVPVVAGESVSASPTPRLIYGSPTIAPNLHPTPLPKKQEYTVSFFGDSMVETMGKDMLDMKRSFSARYPLTLFKFYNYGKGAENIEDAFNRIKNLGVEYSKSDIIVMGSYAYNPFIPNDIEKHTRYLALLTKYLQTKANKVYLLSELSPKKVAFASGAPGINYSADEAYAKATEIISLLENTINWSRKNEVPLINVYALSQKDSDKSGDSRYISSSDNIHPSEEGKRFTAEVVAATVELDK